MSRGTKKTVLERQVSVYNQFQHTIRKADMTGDNRKAAISVTDQITASFLRAAEENARINKEKAIAEFKKTEPVYGNLAALTADEVKIIAAERSQWVKSYHKFLQGL